MDRMDYPKSQRKDGKEREREGDGGNGRIKR